MEYPSPSSITGVEITILPVAAVRRWLKDMVGRPRVAELGLKNVALVESARAAAERVVNSEAARAGWLGDVDFAADLELITAGFRKAYPLRRVIGELSALDNPNSLHRPTRWPHLDGRTSAGYPLERRSHCARI